MYEEKLNDSILENGKNSGTNSSSDFTNKFSHQLNSANFHFQTAQIFLDGPETDCQQGFIHCQEAALLDHLEAQHNLGRLYYHGIGTTADKKMAAYWFMKAQSRGHLESKYFMGFMHEKGIGVEWSLIMAVEYYCQAAMKGHLRAIRELASIYVQGIFPDKKYLEPLMKRTILDLANNEDALSQVILGRMYEEGRVISQDLSLARKWYLIAADNGNLDGLTRLGQMYYDGTGVEKDGVECLKWSLKAAEVNDPTAMGIVGMVYLKGFDVEVDYEKALYWFQKGADLGSARCMYGMAAIYYDGLGVMKNYEIGREYERKFYIVKGTEIKDSIIWGSTFSDEMRLSIKDLFGLDTSQADK